MSVNGKEPDATVKPHGTEPTKPLDGIEKIHSEALRRGVTPPPPPNWDKESKALSAQRSMELMLQWLPQLTNALLVQAEAIDRLAASNESLVETLILDVTQDDGEPIVSRYMDGSKVS